MHLVSQQKEFQRQLASLERCVPDDWDDIAALLNQVSQSETKSVVPPCEDPLQFFARGAAFITFSYGVDGVSIEIIKTARALGDLLAATGDPSVHLICESFDPKVVPYLDPAWIRVQIDGIDGWDKWDEGRWFSGLFREKMEAHSDHSTLLAREIFRQAISIAGRLGNYLLENNIPLLIPVNIASNPGNMALTLGLVLATEVLGTYVLNINHDFYWEGGRPDTERDPEERPGVRDHFFRNRRNRSFFALFRDLYPWNGSRWIQVNINSRQSKRLIERHGFPDDKVFEIPTFINDSFFDAFDREEVIDSRLRMAHILSDGHAVMHPVPIDEHMLDVSVWMKEQQPIILGARAGLSVDPKSDDLIVLLQPTRIVRRKRIERNLALVDALMRKGRLREEFENNPKRQLILHITGPTPMEHQSDLERVLKAYRKTVRNLGGKVADRIYIAFSVGRETHSSFADKGFEPLSIEAIYRMADAVVFPSETEGRGLPIIEASACGIPIICSQYHHREVFAEVVGEGLPDEYQIRYVTFPQVRFSARFLATVAELLLDPDSAQDIIRHNIEAVRARYSQEAFQRSFHQMLAHLCDMD
jgi:glycosyltransferase involved in cell wall biosynthesis